MDAGRSAPPENAAPRLLWPLYWAAWLPYLLAYAAVLGLSAGEPARWATAYAAANVLAPAALGWSVIVGVRAVERRAERTGRSEPIWRRPRRVATHAAIAVSYVAACVVGTWLLFLLLAGLRDRGWSLRFEPTGPLLWQALIATLLYAVLAGVGLAAALQEKVRHETERAARARGLAAEAQLEALRARLDPHFLFNALHSLLALIRRQPAEAEAVVESFGDLLRYALRTREPDRETVALREEWAFVRRYLELEALRFPRRLSWRSRIPDEAMSCGVPAFTLQPLIENVLRHAVAPRRAPVEIVVTASVGDGRLRLEVADDGPGADAHDPRNGLGLDLVRRRLEAHHGGLSSFEIVTAPDAGFVVRLALPAETLSER